MKQTHAPAARRDPRRRMAAPPAYRPDPVVVIAGDWVTVDDVRSHYVVAADGGVLWLAGGGRTIAVEEVREAPVRADDAHAGDAELTSPMPGSVVTVGVRDGAQVAAGDVVVTVEAMKMEHALSAPVDGVVELLVAVGDQVKVGQPLARITAIEEAKQS